MVRRTEGYEGEYSQRKYEQVLPLLLWTLWRSIGFDPAVCTLLNAHRSSYLSPSTASRFDLLWGKKNTLTSVYEAFLWEVCCLGPAQQFQVGAIDRMQFQVVPLDQREKHRSGGDSGLLARWHQSQPEARSDNEVAARGVSHSGIRPSWAVSGHARVP